MSRLHFISNYICDHIPVFWSWVLNIRFQWATTAYYLGLSSSIGQPIRHISDLWTSHILYDNFNNIRNSIWTKPTPFGFLQNQINIICDDIYLPNCTIHIFALSLSVSLLYLFLFLFHLISHFSEEQIKSAAHRLQQTLHASGSSLWIYKTKTASRL